MGPRDDNDPDLDGYETSGGYESGYERDDQADPPPPLPVQPSPGDIFLGQLLYGVAEVGIAFLVHYAAKRAGLPPPPAYRAKGRVAERQQQPNPFGWPHQVPPQPSPPKRAPPKRRASQSRPAKKRAAPPPPPPSPTNAARALADAILIGVSVDATEDQIRKRWRELVRERMARPEGFHDQARTAAGAASTARYVTAKNNLIERARARDGMGGRGTR